MYESKKEDNMKRKLIALLTAGTMVLGSTGMASFAWAEALPEETAAEETGGINRGIKGEAP